MHLEREKKYIWLLLFLSYHMKFAKIHYCDKETKRALNLEQAFQPSSPSSLNSLHREV